MSPSRSSLLQLLPLVRWKCWCQVLSPFHRQIVMQLLCVTSVFCPFHATCKPGFVFRLHGTKVPKFLRIVSFLLVSTPLYIRAAPSVKSGLGFSQLSRTSGCVYRRVIVRSLPPLYSVFCMDLYFCTKKKYTKSNDCIASF